MQEHKLSDQATTIRHDDGHLEIVKMISTESMQGYRLRIELTVEESKELFRLASYNDVPTPFDLALPAIEIETAMHPFVADSDDTIVECPSCHRKVKKVQILRSPIGDIFCDKCKHEDCEHCLMTKAECMCVK
jgi:hypothetical protein